MATEPRLETPLETLDAALACTPFVNDDKPPVLLVHGTFTTGFEQFDWTWAPILRGQGFDVCTITYPDRGLIDQQTSAEFVVHALRRMRAESGRKVAVIGHSQGVTVPRWAIRFWPSAREAVEDFVMLAGPNAGTDVSLLADTLGLLPALLNLPIGLVPEALFQFAPDSDFITALNRDGQSFPGIDYTTVYTRFDELVQPVAPVPTAAIDFGLDNPRVSNILLQDICPGRLVDHVTIGLTESMSFALALDALAHPGPADVERAGGAAGLCGLLSLLPGLELAPLPELISGVVGILAQEPANGLPALHLASEEPPLRAYAR